MIKNIHTTSIKRIKIMQIGWQMTKRWHLYIHVFLIDVQILRMEERAVIKFHAKLGKNVPETFRIMQRVYDNDCLSRSNVFVWHKRFLDGRESLEEKEHTGRLVSVQTPEMIKNVRDFIANDRNSSLKMMEKAVNINRYTKTWWFQCVLTTKY